MRQNLLSKLLGASGTSTEKAATAEIARLLNTRHFFSWKEKEGMPESLQNSALCYGLHDFTGLISENAVEVARLGREMERCIKAHCPRVKRVAVTRIEEAQARRPAATDALFFRISVVLYGGSSYYDGAYNDELEDVSATLDTYYTRSGTFRVPE